MGRNAGDRAPVVVGQRTQVEACDRRGRRFPAEVAVAAVDGAPDVRYSAFVRDITERVESHQALERAMAARSAFLATMSHEIRTPLNAVVGMTGLLLDTALDTEQQEYVETVRASSDQLLALINDILDFSKIESGTLELEERPFSLRECVEAALDVGDEDIAAARRTLVDQVGPDGADEIIAGYLIEAATAVAELEAAVAADDVERAGRVAHSLRPTSQTVGAHAVAGRCLSIERAEGDLGQHVRAIVTELERVRAELRRHH